MSQTEIKNLYDSMVSNGDLQELFPQLTGEWESDKSEFKSIYMSNEHLLDSIDDDFDLEDDYEF